MILSVPALVGLLVGRLAGGRLSHLATVPLKPLWIIAGGFLVQLLSMKLAASGTVGSLGYRVLLMAGFLVVAVGFWQLRRLRGAWLVLLAVALQLTVLAANGGTMTITPEAAAAGHFAVVDPRGEPHVWGAKVVLREWDQTALPWLTDWLVVRVGTFERILSPVDVLLAAGVGVLAFHAVRRPLLTGVEANTIREAAV